MVSVRDITQKANNRTPKANEENKEVHFEEESHSKSFLKYTDDDLYSMEGTSDKSPEIVESSYLESISIDDTVSDDDKHRYRQLNKNLVLL